MTVNFTAFNSKKLMCLRESESDHCPDIDSPDERTPPHPELEASVDIVKSCAGVWILAPGKELSQDFHQFRSSMEALSRKCRTKAVR